MNLAISKMKSASHKTWQTSLLFLKLLQIQNLKRKHQKCVSLPDSRVVQLSISIQYWNTFRGGYDDIFYIKFFGICPTIGRWKIVSNEILPNVLSITGLFLDLPTVNIPLFRTDKAFCFFHYLTLSLKGDLNLKQALCTSAIAWSYCFLHHQLSVLYTGLQSERHTCYICTFLVQDACTYIFCFHQTLWNWSYRYAECFSALDHDRRKSCYCLWKHWCRTVCK